MAQPYRTPEPIIEHDSINPAFNRISSANKPLYNLYPLKDKWVFPWKYRTIKLNMNNIYLPDNTVGMIMSYSNDNFYVLPKAELGPQRLTEIKVKANGLLPVKINVNYPVAFMMVLKPLECHLVEVDN